MAPVSRGPRFSSLRAKLLVAAVAAALALAVALPGLQLLRGRRFLATGGFRERRAFLQEQSDLYVADPLCGHLHRPGARRLYDWPEHPAGKFLISTNSLGLREDAETPLAPAAGMVRILLTGDSHADGVVDNRDSMATRLEGLLGPRFDVAGAAVGYYGPWNYPRVLERWKGLGARAEIVVLYAGNDFLDAAAVLEETGLAKSTPDEEYRARLGRARSELGPGVGQSLDQAFYFARFPGIEPLALDFTEGELARAAQQSRERGARLFVAILPSKIAVEPGDAPGFVAGAREILGLGDRELAVESRLSGELARRLTARGIPVLDLGPALRGAAPGGYWRADHHLSLRGHRVAAEAMATAWGDELRGLASR